MDALKMLFDSLRPKRQPLLPTCILRLLATGIFEAERAMSERAFILGTVF